LKMGFTTRCFRETPGLGMPLTTTAPNIGNRPNELHSDGYTLRWRGMTARKLAWAVGSAGYSIDIG
jgi:hypothetical protein